MNSYGWILEGTMASVIWQGRRLHVWVSHSRLISTTGPRREYLCHHHSNSGIETFEVGDRDIRH